MTYNVFSGMLNPTQSQSALDGSRGEAPSTILRVLCTVDCLVTYLFYDLCILGLELHGHRLQLNVDSVESRQFKPTPPAFGASVGVIPFEFCRDIRHQETSVPVLPCGVLCVILCLTISIEHRLVTDRDTRLRHTPR